MANVATTVAARAPRPGMILSGRTNRVTCVLQQGSPTARIRSETQRMTRDAIARRAAELAAEFPLPAEDWPAIQKRGPTTTPTSC